MKKMKRIILVGGLLIASIGLMTGCAAGAPTAEKSTASSSTVAKTEEIQVDVTITSNKKEVTSKELTLAKGENLLAALEANFDIKEDAGFITSIEGIEQDTKEGIYWTYTVNGEMATTGAKETILNEGDKVEFSHEKFEQ